MAVHSLAACAMQDSSLKPAPCTRNMVRPRRVAARAIRLSPNSLLEHNARRFLQKLEDSMQRWEACPGSRRQIEHLIAARMADRVRGHIDALTVAMYGCCCCCCCPFHRCRAVPSRTHANLQLEIRLITCLACLAFPRHPSPAAILHAAAGAAPPRRPSHGVEQVCVPCTACRHHFPRWPPRHAQRAAACCGKAHLVASVACYGMHRQHHTALPLRVLNSSRCN